MKGKEGNKPLSTQRQLGCDKTKSINAMDLLHIPANRDRLTPLKASHTEQSPL